MANTKNSKSNTQVLESGFDEVSKIREILMGQHIVQSESQYQQMLNRMEELSQQLERKIDEVNKFHKLATLDLTKSTDQRFNKLEKMMVKQVRQLETTINSTSVSNKKELGRMLTNMGKKLIGE